MKISVNTKELISILKQFKGIVSSKNVRPVLSNILLEYSIDGIFLSGTNLDQYLKVKISSGNGDMNFASILLDYAQLSKMITAFKKQNESTIEEKEGFCWLNNVSVKSEISVDDFPPSFTFDMISSKKVVLKNASEVLKNMLLSASSDNTSVTQKSVFFNLENNCLDLTATDSRRMTIYKETCNQESGNVKMIIPSDTIKTIIGIGIDNLEVYFNDGIGKVYSDSFELYFRVIEGRFPNYMNIIPKDKPTIVIGMELKLLQEAVNNAVIVAKARKVDKGVFNFHDGMLELSIDGSRIGFPIPVIGNEGIEIAFNIHYIQDMLKMYPDKSDVQFTVTAYNYPVVLYCGAYIGIVMPMTK
jgi:DNA polymerase-3 subunit beta